ncbi:hypothetical protein A3F07_03425 [candidate division WWE3 bacterium RIFCSPHIGHO2_12_FULL_38_15]|uniref:Uncharacterized protein n=1 Tax=candidate division WWE3 bacterium RIFCSPHIGHO2_02_FULL_38_14 TaxID=1802620 RepID=A0A1F4V6I4_UNCKA|nr:MAG: hypothetical protein A2793_02960 [candidate division WWE3 bacterium RIFCSPHIGHO2_01_FULL_38_45]OGC48852.1 MAG: hypothetical protein A3F07_03425 [candidate division WWE3 bacterium RIFCSPHIGHO2_12_FULL_38_15]OGC52808.1 MAG: hypothetical protein A3D91_02115 [candidate division WWE3 bacterium RIFCSPHIGHO2_02_FULL_38_14]OGC53155.1 MAG: hypothetical protein A3B64_01765 [candidate division WWE3 bacterium RIFCSPLOWO2_01_FULL_37_24]HLB51995.1 tetratricopeptide repeat protein [Patescibacteria gro
MQNGLPFLTKKAIDAALNSKWKEAVSLNLQILTRDPSSTDAKIRLGRAYIQTGEFNKAKRIFKEVLESDPINPVALKNYSLASQKKSEKNHITLADPKSLLKEPGTTAETTVEITAKRITASDFSPGEPLLLKIDKKTISIIKTKREEKIAIGTLNKDFVIKLNGAKQKGAEANANFVNGTGKNIKILIKCSLPIFKAERQDVRPYIKKGSIDEPELEMAETTEEIV